MKRAVFVLGLGAVLVAGNIAAAQPVPPDPRINDARRDLQDARRLALEERYEDAVAEAEAALATLIELRDDDTVLLPDLSVLALNGDGNRVVITIRNNGTEDVIRASPRGNNSIGQVRRTYNWVGIRLYNANTNEDFNPTRPLTTRMTGGLPPGQTKQVEIGSITGCGGMPANILVEVDYDQRIEELDELNNVSEVLQIRGGPCGS